MTRKNEDQELKIDLGSVALKIMQAASDSGLELSLSKAEERILRCAKELGGPREWIGMAYVEQGKQWGLGQKLDDRMIARAVDLCLIAGARAYERLRPS